MSEASRENRQWLLAARPVGMVKQSDFELRSTSVPEPGAQQLLVRNRWLAFEPAMRGWMEDRPNYIPPVPIGDVMRGMAVGEVIASNLDGYRPGDLVTGMTGWQERAATTSKSPRPGRAITSGSPLSVAGWRASS